MSANSARQALETLLPRSGRVLVQGCSAESALLADAAADLGDRLGALVYTGVRVPGFNTRSWLPSAGSRFETFFMTPELAARRQQVDFLPLCYTDILRRLRNLPIAAALFSVSPPDDNGDCSFGPAVDFLAELWPQIPVRIAHVNPLLPRTSGPTIPLKALSAAVEAPEPLMTMGEEAADPRTAAIAQHVAGFIADGATLQTGLGKLPGAILRALSGLRSLRVHSGLIGDAVLDLLEGGAIADGAHITAGVAIGSQRLYDALPDSGIRFCPVSVTHAPGVIATLPNFVAINSVMSVDLFGQGYSEAGPRGWNSGTGGATDFARGALAGGGLRIVALPAVAAGSSRIVAPGAGLGPVTLGRTDIDIVVTEHGAADLRQLGHDARAAALVAIASPEHRESLARAWRDGPGRY